MILLFPLFLTAGTLMIPFVRWFGDHESAEKAIIASPQRWVSGHLLVAAAFGLGGVNVAQLVEVSWLAVLAAVGGGTLAAGLGADGIAPVVLHQHGLAPRLFLNGVSLLIPATFAAGIILFGTAQVWMIVGVNQARLLPLDWGIAALLATIGFSVLPAIPSSWSLYATALLSWIIYLPLAIFL